MTKTKSMFIKPETIGNPKPEKKPKPKKRIKQVSEKRRHELAVYAKLKKVFMEENQICERCGAKATELHHRSGRRGKDLIRWNNFCALCHDCHEWTTINSYQAILDGYSEYRNR